MQEKTTVRSQRFTRVTLIATGVLSLMLAAIFMPAPDAAGLANHWALSLPAAERQRLLVPGELGRLPVEYRRAFFNNLAKAEERAQFWRGVFLHYRRTHAISPAQGVVLGNAEVFLVPAMFERKQKPSEELQRAVTAVREALGVDAARELFRYAGGASSAAGLSPTAKIAYYWQADVQPFIQLVASAGLTNVSAKGFPAGGCQCSVGAYPGNKDENCWEIYQRWEPSGDTCHFNASSCPEGSWTTFGCGPYWMSPCDGECGA